jgi:hypothetical protein
MQDIIVEIELIREHYAGGAYLQAYDGLHHLCSDHPDCAEFSRSALSILSQFNDLQNSITSMNLDLGQQHVRKTEIGGAFIILIEQMQRRFDTPASGQSYDEQASRMSAYRNKLRSSLMVVEDDISDCGNPEKVEVLQQIYKQLTQVIKYLRDLSKSFCAVKNYE